MAAFAMERRIAGFRLLIPELRKSAINDDHNRDCLSTENVEEPETCG